MHDKPNQADHPDDQDRRNQAAVLDHVLALHPESATVDELVRELSSGEAEFSQRDQLLRATRDLTGVGLLRAVGELVMPTRAAVVFDALREES